MKISIPEEFLFQILFIIENKWGNKNAIYINVDLNRPKFFPYRLFLNMVIVRLRD